MRLILQTATVAASLALAACVSSCGTYAHSHRGAMALEIDSTGGATGAGSATQLAPKLRQIAVGPLTVSGTSTVSGSEPEATGSDGLGLSIDCRALRESLRDTLRRSGAFDRVDLTEDLPAGSEEGLTLETHLTRASLRRRGDEDGSLAPYVVWSVSGVVANWQHDRTYELSMEPTFVVKDRRGGARLLDFRAPTGKAKDALSFYERRGGSGAFAATFFGFPQMALDSSPGAITRSLAPAGWIAPTGALLDRMSQLRVQYRVRQPRAYPEPRISAHFLTPAPGTVLAGVDAEVRVRLSARPGSRVAFRKVIVGGSETAASGTRFDAPITTRLTPGKPLVVQAVLDTGQTIPIFEIEFDEEVVQVDQNGKRG